MINYLLDRGAEINVLNKVRHLNQDLHLTAFTAMAPVIMTLSPALAFVFHNVAGRVESDPSRRQAQRFGLGRPVAQARRRPKHQELRTDIAAVCLLT